VALTSPCLQSTLNARADDGDTEYQHLASSIEQPQMSHDIFRHRNQHSTQHHLDLYHYEGWCS
jgi:signal transduction protein with GAF and PtsI domain